MIDAAKLEVERVFHESALGGRVVSQRLPALADVLYILPRTTKGPHGEIEHMVLDVAIRHEHLEAFVCLEESGAIVKERASKPTTVDHAREEALALVAWVQTL